MAEASFNPGIPRTREIRQTPNFSPRHQRPWPSPPAFAPFNGLLGTWGAIGSRSSNTASSLLCVALASASFRIVWDSLPVTTMDFPQVALTTFVLFSQTWTVVSVLAIEVIVQSGVVITITNLSNPPSRRVSFTPEYVWPLGEIPLTSEGTKLVAGPSPHPASKVINIGARILMHAHFSKGRIAWRKSVGLFRLTLSVFMMLERILKNRSGVITRSRACRCSANRGCCE